MIRMITRVVKFFMLLFVLVILLGAMHVLYFGGLTGYSVLKIDEQQNQNVDITEKNASSLYWAGGAMLIFLVFGLVLKFILGFHKRTRKMNYVKSGGERHLIEIDLRD